MPTERKVQRVTELEQLLARCTMAIATDFTGLRVDDLTGLRKHLRAQGIEYHIVKNTLTYIAADNAGRPAFKEVVQGPTGLVLGFGDSVEPAKALHEYLRQTRSSMSVRGAVMDGRILSPEQVATLATLPPRAQLLGQLLGQMQAPIVSLLYVLQAPLQQLVTVLQRHIEQQGDGGTATPEAAPEPVPVGGAPAMASQEEAIASQEEPPATTDEPIASVDETSAPVEEPSAPKGDASASVEEGPEASPETTEAEAEQEA